ncbi:hypothetical protein GGR54DRAFT_404606 [Hypoxylon sp. NC1633]|nr:hypothetical protein GGR54DRAFT_404606 [Hypoxylon sp. NC1633]
MSDQGITLKRTRLLRGREFSEASDGTSWTRKIHSDGTFGEWRRTDDHHSHAEKAQQPAVSLILIRQSQLDGEPFYWSLSVGEEGGRCRVFQVKGDAVHMHYQHAPSLNIFESASFHDHYVLAQLNKDGLAQVDCVANTQPPPEARSQAEVKENCQGWTVRVLRELQSVSIVSKEWVDKVEDMKEPID